MIDLGEKGYQLDDSLSFHSSYFVFSFMKARDIKATLPLGFTFSFPCKQVKNLIDVTIQFSESSGRLFIHNLFSLIEGTNLKS